MPKINLHSHSKFSDGKLTFEESCRLQHKLGYCASVVTDHVFTTDQSPLSMSENKYDHALMVAHKLRKEGINVIVGIELSYARECELCVFGEAAIREIYRLRHEREDATELNQKCIGLNDMLAIRAKYKTFVSLCHPNNVPRFLSNGHLPVIDAFERWHAGQDFFRNTLSQFPDLKGKLWLCNSDAHNAEALEWCWNEVERDITSTEDLIDYFQQGGSWRPRINRGSLSNVDE